MYTVADYVNTMGHTDKNLLLLEASKLLETLEVTNHLDAIDRTITELDELTPYDAQALIENILLVELREVLKENKVVLVKDADDLILYMEIIRTLFDTDLTIFKEQIETLVDEVEDGADFICELVSMVCDRPAIEYRDVIEATLISLTDDILSMLENEEELTNTEDHETNCVSCVLNPKKAFSLFNPTKLRRMVDEGFGFDYSLKIYLDELFKDGFNSKDLLLKQKYTDWLNELTVAVAICKEGLEGGLLLLEPYMEELANEEIYLVSKLMNDIKLNINGAIA